MKIPPYWTKATYRGQDPNGKDHVFTAYGWSFHSQAGAREDAIARARRMFDRVILNRTESSSYDYLDRPLRSFRLYRTAAGLRLLFTDQLCEPTSQEVVGLLKELGSDPLYQRLTAKQECFRARLTPKPWRCGCKRPPFLYPWDTPDQERQYRRWQAEYEAKARSYATCQLLQSFGRPAAVEQIALVLSSHDQYTCGRAQSRLA